MDSDRATPEQARELLARIAGKIWEGADEERKEEVNSWDKWFSMVILSAYHACLGLEHEGNSWYWIKAKEFLLKARRTAWKYRRMTAEMDFFMMEATYCLEHLEEEKKDTE